MIYRKTPILVPGGVQFTMVKETFALETKNSFKEKIMKIAKLFWFSYIGFS